MTAQPDDAPRGFVPMRDYLRLQRRCDALEAKLAERREAERDEAEEERIDTLRRRLGLGPQQARALLVLWDANKPLTKVGVVAERADIPTQKQVNIILSRANATVRATGGPEYLIAGKRGIGGGLFVTDEGRAWLAERVPEVFAKGAAR